MCIRNKNILMGYDEIIKIEILFNIKNNE
jgi:hypothetical protein